MFLLLHDLVDIREVHFNTVLVLVGLPVHRVKLASVIELLDD